MISESEARTRELAPFRGILFALVIAPLCWLVCGLAVAVVLSPLFALWYFGGAS